MKIGILEASEDIGVSPRHHRTKAHCLRLVARGVADWVNERLIQLREGIKLAGLRSLLADFQQDEVWRPTFEIRFDPSLRESPALKYPLLIARRQQSFAYLGAAYA